MNNKYVLNIAILLFVPFLLLLTNSCGDDDEDQITGFEIVKTLINEAPGELNGTIELSSSDFEYTVAHDWCLVTKNGNVLNIEAEGNYDYRNRSTEIVIVSGNKKYRVPVTQRGVLLEFTNNKFSAFNFGYIGGERSVRILSNIEYEMLIPEKDKDWITVIKRDNGYYDLIIEKSTHERNSTVTFKYYDKELTITIRQYDFFTFEQVLGPATMYYYESRTDTVGMQIETEVEFLKKTDTEFLLKGTFGAGIERQIPVKYAGSADGELRFHPCVVDDKFRDNTNAKVQSLSLSIVHYNINANNINSNNEALSYGATIYIPAKFNITDEGVVYEFKHSEAGLTSKSPWTKEAYGICTFGGTATHQVAGGQIYDKIYYIKILKKLATEPVTEP